jgi:hypothetical protein
MAIKYSLTQAHAGGKQWEAMRNKGFGKKVRSSINLVKVGGMGNPNYGVMFKVYHTKEIGLFKDEAVTKVVRNRTKTFANLSTAMKHIHKFKKEGSRLI